MTGAERAACVVAVVAFAMSASALYAYARDAAGFTVVTAAGMPIIVDALVLVAGQISLDRHTHGVRSGLAGVVFWTAIAVSLTANYAHAVPAIGPTDLAHAVGGVFAALPPLALAGSYELVVRERRRRATTPPSDTHVAPRTPLTTVEKRPAALPGRASRNGSRPATTADAPLLSLADPTDVAEIVTSYLATDTGRSVHDGQLTAVVADELGVSARTARRRLRQLRETDSGATAATDTNSAASSGDRREVPA